MTLLSRTATSLLMLTVPADKKEQFEHLVDALEDNDDVQNVYTAAADED